MFYVGIGKKDSNVLVDQAAVCLGYMGIKNIDRTTQVWDHYAFDRKYQAVDFAIWAAGWIPAFRKDGVCPAVHIQTR